MITAPASRNLPTASKAAAVAGDARAAANWVMGDLAGLLKQEGKEITESPVTPENLGSLVALITQGKISGKLAKEIFVKMFAGGESPEAIMERDGLRQINDERDKNADVKRDPKPDTRRHGPQRLSCRSQHRNCR